MAIGDQTNFVGRLLQQLPKGWFPTVAPRLNAVLQGPALALSLVYSMLTFVKAQTRVNSSSGAFLDIAAADFFGVGELPRFQYEQDPAYKARILYNLTAPRGTLAGMTKMLEQLCGNTPYIMQPNNPVTCGGYASLSNPTAGGGVLAFAGPGASGGGAWGTLQLPAQVFITVAEPVGGYAVYGGYGGFSTLANPSIGGGYGFASMMGSGPQVPSSIIGTPQIYRKDWQGNQLLYPTARTNYIANGNMSSSVLGTIGSGTFDPVDWNWAWNGGANGLTATVVNSGTTANGIAFVDIQVTGTPTASVNFFLGSSGVSCPASGFLTYSGYFAMVAGSVSPWVVVGNYNSSGVFINQGTVANKFTPGATLSRVVGTPWEILSGSAQCFAQIYFQANQGVAVNFTIRIAAQQLELGSVATSYIPTTNGPSTTTDYAISASGLVTLAVPLVKGASLTWSGTYTAPNVPGQLTANAQAFGVGNGTQTAFQIVYPGGQSMADPAAGGGGIAFIDPDTLPGVITNEFIYQQIAAWMPIGYTAWVNIT